MAAGREQRETAAQREGIGYGEGPGMPTGMRWLFFVPVFFLYEAVGRFIQGAAVDAWALVVTASLCGIVLMYGPAARLSRRVGWLYVLLQLGSAYASIAAPRLRDRLVGFAAMNILFVAHIWMARRQRTATQTKMKHPM